MSEASLAALLAVLDGTLSDNNTARVAAESELRTLSAAPGFLSALLHVLGLTSVAAGNRTAAAVAFKNAVLQHWHDDEPSAPPHFTESEKEFVRGCILEATVAQREPPIVNSLAEAARRIFGHDFPDRWPSLPARLLALLRRGEPHAAAVATALVREMAKQYQFKADEAQAPLRMLVDAVFPTLAAAVSHCLPPGGATAWPPGSPPLPVEAGLVVVNVLKALYSTTQLHLPLFPAIAAAPHFLEWAALIFRVAALELPAPGAAGEPSGMPADEDDRPKWPWWRARKWALKIFATWADRFGKPSLFVAGTPQHAVATALNKAVAPRLSALLVAQLRAWSDAGDGARYLPPSVVWQALRFLQAALGFASAWRGGLADALPLLLRVVVPRLVRITPEELEMLAEEPAEYIRRAADPFGAAGSPRYAALLLLGEAIRARGKEALPLLEAELRDAVVAHAAAPTLATALAKDAALAMLVEVSSEYKAKRQRRAAVLPILVAYVTPELASPFVPLRARAASVWAAFADMPLPAAAGAAGAAPFSAATAGVLRVLLDDASPVARCAAAVALRAMLAVAPGTEEVVRPAVVPVLRRLFADLEAVGLDEVVETISIIVQVFADELPAIALPVVSQIVALWRRTMDAAAAAEAAGTSGGDGYDADEAALAAEGMVSAVRTVVDVLVEARRIDVLRTLLPALWPLLRDIIDPAVAEADGLTGPLESLDAAMGLLGDIIDVFTAARAQEWAAGVDDEGAPRGAAPGAPLPGELAAAPELAPVWALLPRLLTVYTAAALDFADDLVGALDGLLQDPPSMARLVAGGPDPASGVALLPALLDAVAHTEENGDEETRASLASFCMGLLHWGHGGAVDAALPRLITIYIAGALVPGAPHEPRTSSLRGRLAALTAAFFTYNARAALALVDAVTPGGGGLAAVLPPWLTTLPSRVRRSFYTKVAILGLTSLLRTVPLAEMPPALQSALPALLTALAGLQLRYERLLAVEARCREEEEAEEAEEEAEEEEVEEGPRSRRGGGSGVGSGAAATLEDEDEDEGEDDEGDGKPDGDGDVVDESDIAYARERIRRADAAAAAAAGEEGSDADSEEDADSIAENVPPEVTPLDHIPHLAAVAEALACVGAQPGARDVLAHVPPQVASALSAMAAAGARAGAAQGGVAVRMGPAR